MTTQISEITLLPPCPTISETIGVPLGCMKRIAETAVENGLRAGEMRAPSMHKSGKRSWIRMEPLRNGVRAEIHLHNEDDIEKMIAKLRPLLKKRRQA